MGVDVLGVDVLKLDVMALPRIDMFLSFNFYLPVLGTIYCLQQINLLRIRSQRHTFVFRSNANKLKKH